MAWANVGPAPQPGAKTMAIRKEGAAALVLLAVMVSSSAASTDLIISKDGPDLSASLPLISTDHPGGCRATVTLVSVKRAKNLDEPTLSTFVVDYAPGASATLHRTPSSGYVLVYVLSGTIHAFAWKAGVGTYRTGETWVESALANDIATENASSRESARALVILVTSAQS
jgi:quercetin dioxygenase-like cupin family protein